MFYWVPSSGLPNAVERDYQSKDALTWLVARFWVRSTDGVLPASDGFVPWRTSEFLSITRTFAAPADGSPKPTPENGCRPVAKCALVAAATSSESAGRTRLEIEGWNR